MGAGGLRGRGGAQWGLGTAEAHSAPNALGHSSLSSFLFPPPPLSGPRLRGVSAGVATFMHRKVPHMANAGNAGATAPVQPSAPVTTDMSKPSQCLSPRAFVFMGLWYFTSMVTLFLNKHILSGIGGSPQILGMAQMTTTCVMGAAKARRL